MANFATNFRRGTRAGQLRHRLGFFKRQTTDDGYGNTETGFPDAPEFVVFGEIVARFGGEAVQAARLQGEQVYLLTVRQSSLTRDVTTAWMVKDMNEGTIFAIQSGPVDPDDSGAFYEILAKSGVAA